jgi:Cft2 family RNA processing exonuclease
VGGGPEVGANCYLVSAAGKQIILDSGSHPKKEGLAGLPDFTLIRRPPEAVLVTHGHIDHCGSLPVLIRNFPSTRVFATKPTLSIVDRMLHNSVSVMGTIALERGITEYPLYTHTEVEDAMRGAYGLGFNQEFALSIDGEARASFHHSGHVLGSASILLRTPGHNLFYTGDVCVADQELMNGLTPLSDKEKVDTLVIECTYGASPHADDLSIEDEILRFGREAAKVLERGGSVLAPSFALGRTQELLNVVARLQDEGILPETPVYASGLGRAIYEIYEKYPDYLKPNARLSPLRGFKRIGDVWERGVAKELLREPSVIVATSGMMIENTPSAMIAQEMVRDKRHGVFFVGYLDPDTLGYKLRHGAKGDKLLFELSGHAVKVELENIQSFHFSAHAPRRALQSIVEHIKPKNIVFVHGDPDAIQWMSDTSPNGCRKYSPAMGQTITLDS